ncbi:MAG: hypothetical protein B7Z10_09905 [Rhodobacterales bacterium 32-66-7]|nr:MAG: hypothetical protein B7Z10_09905 [Rhodobacterales bacterium 32-66-7]
MQKTLALMVALALPLPVAASDFLVVSDRGEFLSLVQDRELRLAMLGLSLSVKPDGTIEGQALGSEVTGTWAWQDGFFCREMAWNGKAVPYNCQVVEVKDAASLRFTSDQGKGDSAVFQLR